MQHTRESIIRSRFCILMVFSVACIFCAGLSAYQQPEQKPPDNKIMTDQAEYDAYTQAVNTSDPMKRAEALVAFVAKYPQSVVKEDAQVQQTAAYQEALGAFQQ